MVLNCAFTFRLTLITFPEKIIVVSLDCEIAFWTDGLNFDPKVGSLAI